MEKRRLKNGDRVLTNTHAIHQNSQEPLTGLKGIIKNNKDYPWNIHVEIKINGHNELIGFSEFELTKI